MDQDYFCLQKQNNNNYKYSTKPFFLTDISSILFYPGHLLYHTKLTFTNRPHERLLEVLTVTSVGMYVMSVVFHQFFSRKSVGVQT